MCGIVGCAGNLNKTEYKVFRDMLIMDAVRGQDSTGVLRVPCNDKVFPAIYKDVGLPDNLWNDYSVHKHAFDRRGIPIGFHKVLLGHNRAATQGVIDVDNSHPFNYDDIYGVHNGTLWNDDNLVGEKDDIDSKKLIQNINKEGIEKTWPKVKGAAAVVWWDDEEETLNFIRNDERTLFWLRDDKNNMYWASERWMIEAAMARNGVKHKESKEGNRYIPTIFKENHVYTYKVPVTGGPSFQGMTKLKEYDYKDYVAGKKHQTGFQGTSTTNGSSFKGHTPSGAYNPQPETRDEKENINKKWAYGLDKGPKELRDSLLSFSYCCKVWSTINKEYNYYCVAHITENGKPVRVSIYNNTIKSYNQWKEREQRRPKGQEMIVRMTARPRVVINNANTVEYAISDKHIKFVEFREAKKKKEPEDNSNVVDISDNFVSNLEVIEEEVGLEKLYPVAGGKKVNLRRFRYELEKAGSACASCDNILTEDDADCITWVDNRTCLCNECMSSPWISNLIGAYGSVDTRRMI